MLVTVPKSGILIITFSGTNLPLASLPLGYTSYKKPTGLTINDNLAGNTNLTTPVAPEFTAIVSGSDRFTQVGWDIKTSRSDLGLSSFEGLDNSNNSKLTLYAVSCFWDKGIVTVTGYLKDNPNIRESRILTITGAFDLDEQPCVNAVNKNISNSGFIIYPNPSKGSIKIKAEIEGLVTITDLQGRLVTQLVLNMNNKSVESNLEPGVYLVNFKSNTSTVTRKIIITP